MGGLGFLQEESGDPEPPPDQVGGEPQFLRRSRSKSVILPGAIVCVYHLRLPQGKVPCDIHTCTHLPGSPVLCWRLGICVVSLLLLHQLSLSQAAFPVSSSAHCPDFGSLMWESVLAGNC